MSADANRFSTYSSSSAWKLMTKDKSGKKFGAPGIKYIKQVGYEIKLGRAVGSDFDSKQTSWGHFNERRVFNLLPTSYQFVANDRLFHHEIKHYSGVPDYLDGIYTVADCKCPFNMEKFCDKMEALKSIETFREDFPEDYWQLISNIILLRANGINIKFIEAINYVPYKSELQEIRDLAEDNAKMKWLSYTDDDGLPWIRDGGNYTNLNRHRFEVIEKDVDELQEQILKAVELLK